MKNNNRTTMKPTIKKKNRKQKFYKSHNNRSTLKNLWNTRMKHDNEAQQWKTTYKHSNVTQQWKKTTVKHWKTRMKKKQQSYNNHITIVQQWKNNETQEWENNNCSTIIQHSYNKEKQWKTKMKHTNQTQQWRTTLKHSNEK